MRFNLISSCKKIGIPNILSVFRLLLTPAFVLLYFSQIKYSGAIAAAVLVLSGITDVLDGFIARRYHLVSEMGRILDPLADKFTQITVCVCLAIKHAALLWVLCLLILKELVMIAASARIVKRGKKMISAKRYGKFGTAAFYMAVIVIIAFRPSNEAANLLLGLVLGYMLISLILYIPTYWKTITKQRTDRKLKQPKVKQKL